MTGSWTQSFCSSVRIQIHGFSGYLLQFWSYSFNILYDVYTHNGGVHVHRILIFIKYLIIDRQLDLVIFLCPRDEKLGGGRDFCQIFTKRQVVELHFPLTSYIMERWFVWGIIPISPQVIPLYLHIRNEKLKVPICTS